MRTLGVLTVYDSQGVIDNYLLYYAQSLKEATDDLIIVINGDVNSEGLCNLKQISDRIIVRENTGYDAGGYKAALQKYGKEFVLRYDQVVFSNDTCFGPFIPFKTIFGDMDCKKGDFWGFEYLDLDYLSLMGTFFIVFRKSIMADVFDFYIQLDTENMRRNDVVRIAELGLFYYLINQDYKFICYSSIDNYDMYESPNYCTKQCGVPLMKKRCFDPIKYRRDNCIDLLKHIQEHYDYDITLILDVVKRKYGIIYDINYEFSRKLHIEEIKASNLNTLEEILNFAKCDKEVYIYGTGMYGKLIYERINELVNISGFVVSDDQYKKQVMYDKKIYKYSEICLEECKIIVAIKEAKEIKDQLGYRENVLYLF
ncbi:MAG: rhamnan synthesis F family protein [Lachnospiraceae bacterium]|nr:rhamnan synthesis F family protein [Lachnospiraceae bacterium]